MGRQSQYAANRAKVVAAIVEMEAQSSGKPPSLRELSDRVDVSLATLHSYLKKLSQEGLVEWKPRLHRSLVVTEKGRRLNEASSHVPF